MDDMKTLADKMYRLSTDFAHYMREQAKRDQVMQDLLKEVQKLRTANTHLEEQNVELRRDLSTMRQEMKEEMRRDLPKRMESFIQGEFGKFANFLQSQQMKNTKPTKTPALAQKISQQEYVGTDPNGYERFETNDAGKKEICACDSEGNLIYKETAQKAPHYDYKLRRYCNGLCVQIIDHAGEKGVMIATDKKKYSVKDGTPQAKVCYCLDKDGNVDPGTVVIVRELKQGVLAMGSKGMETVKLFNDIHKKHPIALTQSKGKELSDK